MATRPESKTTRRRIGPFVIARKLGVGGMGIVYEAIYDKDGKRYALKVLSPGVVENKQVVARFEREMAILKRMRHPNIVRYFGGGRSGGQQFFAMELMPGGSVEGLVKKQGVVPWSQAVDIMIDTAKALEFAHNKGVIHRDLKPGNLFFCQDGHVKLGDFGIARDTDATALTAAGRTVGTYAYMAPEQIAGHPPICKQTDLYALGCVGFEMLAGRPPFVADSPGVLLNAHLNTPSPRVRDFTMDCPLWLDEVILRLLNKAPEERYFDALATQVALEEVKEKVTEQEQFVAGTMVAGATVAAPRNGQTTRGLSQGKKKKKKKKKSAGPFYEQVWFLAICLVVLIGGVTWAMWPPSEAELYAEAAALMKSNDPDDWQRANQEYLSKLITQFPESPHREQIDEWIRQAEISRLKEKIDRFAQSDSREPENEAERILVAAWRLEEDEPLAAAAKYQGLIDLKKGNVRAENYVILAQQRLRVIESGIGSNDEDKRAAIEEALQEARDFYDEGYPGKARDRLTSIITLYGDEENLSIYVKKAQELLNGKDPADAKPSGAADPSGTASE